MKYEPNYPINFLSKKGRLAWLWLVLGYGQLRMLGCGIIACMLVQLLSAAPATNTAGSFAGLWKTSYGRMRLQQAGNKVEGIYNYAGMCSIKGTVDGQRFKFTYDQPDGEKGEGTFEFAANGSSFEGAWKGGKGALAASRGSWSGNRVPAEPGVIWLVIMEAYWERGLEQEEYSYGQMLKSFFSRVPHVKVRHRFINSGADLRKWCGELPYLAEPVVLYISSHGTAQGISCGPETIGAAAMADCVRHADNLRLLHFGACLVASGDVPANIHKALKDGPTFPISGYDRSVDWGGSAIVDFTYMDLVLARGLKPADAFAQTRKLLTFAGQKEEPGSAIPATGLVFHEPPITQPK